MKTHDASLQMVLNITDVFPSVAEVGQMISNWMITVLIGRPGDGVGDALPGVRVGAAPHVVSRLGHVAGIGDAVLLSFNAVCCPVPACKSMQQITLPDVF